VPFEVQRFAEADRRAWDAFVWKSNNGTLFHTRRFFSYHAPDRFKDHSLVFLDGHRPVAILPAAGLFRDGARVLSSHAGASYGGFVYPESLSVRAAFDAVEALLAYAQKQAFDSVEMTQPPVVYHDRPSHCMDFALYKNGFRYKKREVSSVIPLDFAAEGILDKFKPEARTAYRKSVKLGVRVRETDDFEAFYPILQKNLGLRHHVKPTHTLEELRTLKRLFPERVRFFGAYLDRRLIAGVVNFAANDRVVLAFYISHDQAYQHCRPLNLLFHAIIRWCIEGGYRCLDFGIFTVNEEINWGLGKFKESFGARGVFRDTFVRAF